MSPRVISLLPSATEIICGLDCADTIVGRSHECDFPNEIYIRPVCTVPNLDPASPSGQIDQDVHALGQQSLSIFTLNLDQIQSLQPDLIFTQDQCDVCAVPREQLDRFLHQLNLHPRVVSLNTTRFAGLWQDIHTVADTLRLPDSGKGYIRSLKQRCLPIIETACMIPENKRPSVAAIEWLDPLMISGNWIPDMIELAGGKPVLARSGEPSRKISPQELLAAQPDIVLIIPCGFDLERTKKELQIFSPSEPWKTLCSTSAVRVLPADGHGYFNRPGPRLVESLEAMAEIQQPTLFNFNHQNEIWNRPG